MQSEARRWCVLAVAAALVTVTASCGGSAIDGPEDGPATAPVSVRTDVPEYLRSVAIERPGKFKPPLASADILISSQDPLPASVVRAAERTRKVVATERFSMATFYAEEEQVTYAAVDPETFRRFTPGPTATLQEVWDRIADGEIGLTPLLHQQLPLVDDFVSIGNDEGAQRAHVGAYAEFVPRSRIGALVNDRWAAKLGMVPDNALLVSTGDSDPGSVKKRLSELVGSRGTVQLLANTFGAPQTAVLTGGSVAQAVGSFTYTVNKDGTVNPDRRWVDEYIRTEQVPILGNVTCNKAMLPQLRMALSRIQKQGLGATIHPGEYGGCYVPRFIARDPSRGLSFHTWGTAVDMNVPGNQRGTVGLIDRQVVAIFQNCGFNWGGLWHYTDPMHFELARLVSSC